MNIYNSQGSTEDKTDGGVAEKTGHRIKVRMVGNKMYKLYTLQVSKFSIINYTYVIMDVATHKTLLVDPAWEFNVIDRVLQNIEAEFCGILLTHSHIDHTNLVPEFVKRYDVDVFMTAIEIEQYLYESRNLIPLQDEDKIEFGDSTITCLLTPGHTKGGACYLAEHDLFTGDTVFIEGCGLCFDDSAAKEMFQSLHKIRRSVKPDTCIYPGHSYGAKVGLPFEQVLKKNIYFCIENIQQFVDFRMRPNQSNLFKFF